MESHENFNSSLHDNIDGRQIPAEKISQENCNLKDMKRETSNRNGLKYTVISSFEQLTKEENGNNANTMFHDTLKVIPKMPDSVSQEYSQGDKVTKDTSKNVFQNTGLDPGYFKFIEKFSCQFRWIIPQKYAALFFRANPT